MRCAVRADGAGACRPASSPRSRQAYLRARRGACSSRRWARCDALLPVAPGQHHRPARHRRDGRRLRSTRRATCSRSARCWAARPVTSTYTANEDMLLPAAAGRGGAAPGRRERAVRRLPEPARAAVLRTRRGAPCRRAYASRDAGRAVAGGADCDSAAAQARRWPAPPTTPLQQALTQMHERRVGSVLVVDADGAPQGILTRHDILGRVTLPRLPLDTPIGAVMSAPLHALDDRRHAAGRGAADVAPRRAPRAGVRRRAAGQHRLRARPVRAAAPVAQAGEHAHPRRARRCRTLQRAALDIRRFARNLLGQGVQARQLTELISHLNDVLTESLVQMTGTRAGRRPAARVLAGLRLRGARRADDRHRPGQRPGVRERRPGARPPALAAPSRAAVNEALDACGYPLCKGNVMASNPACCLTPDEWRAALRAVDRARCARGPAQRQHLLRPAAAGRQTGAGAAAARDAGAASRRACRVSSSRWPTTHCATARR